MKKNIHTTHIKQKTRCINKQKINKKNKKVKIKHFESKKKIYKTN